MKRIYQLYTYSMLGDEINDVYTTGSSICIDDTLLDKDIIKVIHAEWDWIIPPNLKYDSIIIEGENDHTLYFEHENGTPLFELRYIGNQCPY